MAGRWLPCPSHPLWLPSLPLAWSVTGPSFFFLKLPNSSQLLLQATNLDSADAMGGCARWQHCDWMQPTAWGRSQWLTAPAGTRAVELLPHYDLPPPPCRQRPLHARHWLQRARGGDGHRAVRHGALPSGMRVTALYSTPTVGASMCCALSTAGSPASPASPLRCSPWHPLPAPAGGR